MTGSDTHSRYYGDHRWDDHLKVLGERPRELKPIPPYGTLRRQLNAEWLVLILEAQVDDGGW